MNEHDIYLRTTTQYNIDNLIKSTTYLGLYVLIAPNIYRKVEVKK